LLLLLHLLLLPFPLLLQLVLLEWICLQEGWLSSKAARHAAAGAAATTAVRHLSWLWLATAALPRQQHLLLLLLLLDLMRQQ
jgi:hypothetical protein